MSVYQGMTCYIFLELIQAVREAVGYRYPIRSHTSLDKA